MRQGLLSISAIVVAHNRPQALLEVISALLAQTYALANIIVVDNASTVPVTDVLAANPKLTIIRCEDNNGGAGGFALGVEAALSMHCDWMWLMDDDAVPHLDALEQLLKPLPLLPNNTAVLSSAVYENNALALQHRRQFNRLIGIESVIAKCEYEKEFVPITTASFVGFLVASVAVSRQGLPNADFFLAYDDTEYSLRLAQAGWLLWLIPASGIRHLRDSAFKLRNTRFSAKHYYNIRNRIVVVSDYCQFPLIARVLATLLGFMLWLVCCRFSAIKSSFTLFKQAVCDGWLGRLGQLN